MLSNEEMQDTLHLPQAPEENTGKWCFAWHEIEPERQAEPGTRNRAVLLKETKWQIGDSIRIAFMDGNQELQARVRKSALKWVTPDGPANLNFIFQDDITTADIRISFKYAGSWSMVGTTCRNSKDVSRPTMNFGWLTAQSSDEDVDRVVLHEFGHALGLTHEHMHPEHGIQWDRARVIADLSGPPNRWDLQKIENNMFRTFSVNETNFSKFDPLSVMLYPIPPEWTKDHFSTQNNFKLSETDKTFVREQYP